MKITLDPAQFVFNPTAKTVTFDNMGGAFVPQRLLCVINVSTGLIIFSTASAPNYGGTFSNGVYTNSVLTYTSTNVGQSASDILQILYDSDSASQIIAGTVSSLTLDSSGNGIGSVIDPSGGYKLKTISSTLAGDGTPILSTPDPISGTDSLNTHLQSSSFGGQLGSPIPLPNNLNALSVGFINPSTGTLVSPKLDPTTNELIVQANFTAAALQNVNITEVGGTALGGSTLPVDIVSQSGGNLETNINFGGVSPALSSGATSASTLRTSSNMALNGTTVSSSLGSNDAGTIRTSSNIAFNGVAATTQSGAVTTGTQRVVLATDQPSVPTTTNINQYGGSAVSLGQKVMTASIPVVVSSDQSALNTALPDLYITGASNGAAGNNNLLAAAGPGELDVSGYKSASVQVISTATSGTFIFEGSNSTVTGTFQAIPAFRLDSVSPNAIATAITATATNLIYIIPVRFRYMRMRVVTGLSTPIQALTRLSQDPFVAPVVNVVNATGSNLNAVISGSLTSAGTVTQATPANLNCTAVVSGATLQSTAVSDIASAAITTTQTSANISQANIQTASFAVFVTAISGAGAAMDVQVQETMDGTNFYTIYTFERITAIGQYYSPIMTLAGTGLRYIRTVSGTTPSITNSLNRIARQGQAQTIRRFIDRTIVPNTLNSNTGSFFCDGVEDFNLIVRCTAQTTAATIALEFSTDGTNWFTSSATVTTVVGIVQAKIDNMQFKFVRANVTAAGSGITLDNLYIGGHSA